MVIADIVNTVVWRTPTSVNFGGGSCGAANFKNSHTNGQGVSKGGASVAGASSVRVIAECCGSSLLVNGHLDRCGLGRAAMEDLRRNMRIFGQSEFHGTLANVSSQGAFTWPSVKVVRAL